MLLFSDLHLSVKTYETSLQVLRHVHQQAKLHQVSIGFLGDFFDHVYNKGTLPVNILNGLMRFFATEWSVPMIMIPGNHDYFDASETEHGLTPFKYASKFITVLDEPTVMNRQLWIPWRRCNKKLHTILQQYQEVDVIFGHFDIVGFKLNPTKLSTEGLLQSAFPTDKPIYTGHYHTPQVHGNIRYLGSPYQLSLSEAEDKKSLIILDNLYQVRDQLPLDIGPKQYKWSFEELTRRQTILQPSDRVVVAATATDQVLTIVSQLEARGVAIHIRKKIVATPTRLEQQQLLTPQILLQNYGKRLNIDRSSKAWQLLEQWLGTTQKSHTLLFSRDVRPTIMYITGFGPFQGTVTVALEGQGLTLLSGECNDSKNASNGAGKSMLTAGAWLWACTGRIDGRGSVSFGGSVLHREADTARVTVSGTVEGRSWSITRSIDEKKTMRLLLTLDNNDCSRATISGTQKAIASELFGLDMSASALHSWLLRNSVWSQMSVPRWLDSSDTQAKNEISPFANMECWLGLYEKSKVEYKTAKAAVQEVVQAIDIKQHQQECAINYYKKQLDDNNKWQQEQAVLIEKATNDWHEAEAKILPKPTVVAGGVSNVRLLRSEMETKRTQIATATARKELLPPQCSTPLPSLLDTHSYRQMKDSGVAEKYQATHALKQYEHDLRHFNASGECASCHRAFEVDSNRKHSLEQQVRAGKLQLVAATTKAAALQKQYEEAVRVEQHHQDAAKLLRLSSEITQSTAEFTVLCAQFSKAEEQERENREYRLLQGKYEHSLQQAQTASCYLQRMKNVPCPFHISKTTVQKGTVELAELDRTKKERHEVVEIMKAVAGWLGPRGIQTYAMEYAVHKLAALTTVWLRRFFRINDIELRAHFDAKERLIRQVVCPSHAGVMSGGQWRRAQLASFMAWREMSHNSFPFLIMDEACTSMDQIGKSSVQDTLKEWCEENERRTCLFITHDSSQHRDTSVYTNHIRILHKGGRSSLIDQLPMNKHKKRKIEHI